MGLGVVRVSYFTNLISGLVVPGVAISRGGFAGWVCNRRSLFLASGSTLVLGTRSAHSLVTALLPLTKRFKIVLMGFNMF